MKGCTGYRLNLIARGLNANSINPVIGALRFFYGTTLERKDIADQLPFARKGDTFPAVLSQDEVLRLLKAESDLKMRTAYTAIYAAGCVCPRWSRRRTLRRLEP